MAVSPPPWVRVLGPALIVLGVASVPLFHSFVETSCAAQDDGRVRCGERRLVFGAIEVGEVTVIEGIEGARVERSCSPRSGSGSQSCSWFLEFEAQGHSVRARDSFNEPNAELARARVEELLRGRATSASYSNRNVVMQVLGSLFVTLPLLVLGLALSLGFRKRAPAQPQPQPPAAPPKTELPPARAWGSADERPEQPRDER